VLVETVNWHNRSALCKHALMKGTTEKKRAALSLAWDPGRMPLTYPYVFYSMQVVVEHLLMVNS